MSVTHLPIVTLNNKINTSRLKRNSNGRGLFIVRETANDRIDFVKVYVKSELKT